MKKFKEFILNESLNNSVIQTVKVKVKDKNPEIGTVFANQSYVKGLYQSMPIHASQDLNLNSFWEKYKKSWKNNILVYKNPSNSIFLVGIQDADNFDIVEFSMSASKTASN